MGTDNLNNICARAVIEGQKINLDGCCYGPSSIDGSLSGKPEPYYYFLAGLIRSGRFTHVFEIGTHYGGSIMSISRGLRDEEIGKSKVLTIDLTYGNESGFKEFPHIKRMQGDALSKKMIKKVRGYFERDIDLLFIDSSHEYDHVKLCIAIYANMLRPKYIILDDIFLNGSMKKLWLEITEEFGEKALDISQIRGRDAEVGFGIIDWGRAVKLNWRYKYLGLQFRYIYHHLREDLKRAIRAKF